MKPASGSFIESQPIRHVSIRSPASRIRSAKLTSALIATRNAVLTAHTLRRVFLSATPLPVGR